MYLTNIGFFLLKTQHTTKLSSLLCYSKIFNDDYTLATLDAKKNLRIVNAKDYEIVSGIHVPNVSKDHFRINSKMISLSSNKNLMAITDVDENIVYVYDLFKKKLAFNVTWHRGLAEVVEFDPLNRYLATGGQDGKLCLWFYNTGKLAYTAVSHQDFLSCITFESTGKFLASAAYDKTIIVMSIYSMSVVQSFRGAHGAAITNMLFVPHTDILITADRSGKVVTWDYSKGTLKSHILLLNSQPTDMCIIKNYFLLISTHSGSVTLYNLKENELVDKNYIFTKDGIQNISYFESSSTIMVFTKQKSIMSFEPFAETKTLKENIQSKEYEKAYKTIRENLILKYSQEAQLLEKAWKDAWDDAMIYLEDNNAKAAKDILQPFANIPEKRKSAKSLIGSYKEFQKFKGAIEKKNYQLAYSLTIAYPMYKDSSVYKVMEDDWSNRVAKALKIIESNPSDIEDKLKMLFGDFRGISSKLDFIKDCRDKKNVLSMFNKLLSQEKYNSCFELIDKYDFLKQIQEYHSLLVLQESLYNQAQDALDNGEWQSAKNYANELVAFPQYREQAMQILTHIDKTASFYTILTQKKYSEMMKLADRYPFLQNLKEYKNFIKHSNKIITQAEEFVPKGNIVQILKIVTPYKKIPQLTQRFGKILSSAYIQQLFYMAKNKYEASSILRALNIYVKIFGVDNSLMVYVTNLKENMELNIINEADLDSEELSPDYTKWANIKLPAKIFE